MTPILTHLTLGQVITELETHHPAKAVPLGFDSPHSYRGYYDQLAFELARDITVGQMLAAAKFALGTTFQGWKGGDYTMSEHTPCWLAIEGNTGESLGGLLLRYMLGEQP